jgi:hypothetical protein
MPNYADEMTNPIKGTGFTTEHATAAIVIGALVLLILIRRGFRGLSVPGVGSVSAS